MREIADETELYDAIGGEQPFYDLVDAFYVGVSSDPPLRALYPPDLGPGKLHLAWFLIQRFGGPDLFNQRRGAPRLRMRHVRYAVTPDQAKRWTEHMDGAIDALPLFHPYKAIMMRFLEDAAIFLINSDPQMRDVAALPMEGSR